MPKMKTKKAAGKRFKITGTGKVKRHKRGLRHLLEHKAHKVKKHAGKAEIVHPSDMKRVKKMFPGQI